MTDKEPGADKRIPPDHDMRYVWPVQWISNPDTGQCTYHTTEAEAREAATVSIHAYWQARYPGWDAPNYRSPRDARAIRERVAESLRYAVARLDWRSMMSQRFQDNGWEQCVWTMESWSRNNDHYTHRSKDDPALLAYVPDDRHGCQGRLVQMTPGRYLTKHYKDTLTERQIAYFATWQATGNRPPSQYADDKVYPLAFATTPEDIVRVYVAGPQSCMSAGMSSYYPKTVHPCYVYGAGDLAVAYLVKPDDTDKVIARALVWPERKMYGRVYPTPGMGTYNRDGYMSDTDAAEGQRGLEDKLVKLGYRSVVSTKTGFDGARILKMPCSRRDKTWVMPYMDNHYGVSRHPTDVSMWVMKYTCEYQADSTGGVITTDGADPDDDGIECENCGDHFPEDNITTVYTAWSAINRRPRDAQRWCSGCTCSHSFHCAGTGRRVASFVGHGEYHNGGTACQDWLDLNCFQSSWSGLWYPNGMARVTMANGETWERSEFEDHGFTCQVTGDNYGNMHVHRDHPGIWHGVSNERIAEWVANQRGAVNGANERRQGPSNMGSGG